MIEIDVPGYENLKLEYLVLDYNGTIAVDGTLVDGVSQLLRDLSRRIEIHIITADTFGSASDQLSGLPMELTIIPEKGQTEAKAAYVRKLGCDRTVAVGNGRNDRLMLSESSLGIAVILKEGAAADTVSSADIVVTDIIAALELLVYSRRLIATLRS